MSLVSRITGTSGFMPYPLETASKTRKRIPKKAIFDTNQLVIKVSHEGKVIVREKVKK